GGRKPPRLVPPRLGGKNSPPPPRRPPDSAASPIGTRRHRPARPDDLPPRRAGRAGHDVGSPLRGLVSAAPSGPRIRVPQATARTFPTCPPGRGGTPWHGKCRWQIGLATS